MSGAELAARRTAAVLADYRNGEGTADPDAFSLWAARLASMLALVLNAPLRRLACAVNHRRQPGGRMVDGPG
jgi:hypothetical protein